MERFRGMQIDKNKEKLDISDHNLMKAWFNIEEEETSWKKTRYETIEWYRRDPDLLKKIEETLLSMIGKRTGFNRIMKKIKISQDKTLKVKKKIKIGRRGEIKILAAEWVDEELRDNIRRRGRLSRRWRIARKKGEPKEVLDIYEKEYKEQQNLSSRMTGIKKGNWEKQKIQEAKTNGKKFWNLIKDLLGKTKNKDEEAYIYTENGEKHNVENIWKEYMESWRKEIYQKTPRTDLTF